MKIKVTNCKDCIFRESDFDPNSMGYDTVDSCILLRNMMYKPNSEVINYHIASYDSFTELGEENFPNVLNNRLPECPLDKEQIIVSL